MTEREKFKHYCDIPVRIIFDLAESKVKIRDFLRWRVGDVIEGDRMAGEHIDINIEDQALGEGEVIVLDNKFAIRITNIYTKEDIMELRVK
jgi:flagellar motor switch protein FliN/FliY